MKAIEAIENNYPWNKLRFKNDLSTLTSPPFLINKQTYFIFK